MKYEKLKAGDIRQEGDEVRSYEGAMNDARHNPDKDPKLDITKWHPTELIGWEILGSDLLHCKYRRKA